MAIIIELFFLKEAYAMERNLEKMVVLAHCPNCNAICVNGHDDDNQINCAKCGRTFVPAPADYIRKTESEYKKLIEGATKHERGGWTSFFFDKK